MQRVNLLSGLPEKKTRLPGKLIILLTVGLCIILLLISMLLEINYAWRYYQLSQVNQQRLAAAKAFQEVARKYPLIASGDPLDERVGVLAEKLSIKNQMWEQITRSTLSQGFVPYLLAFANHTPRGVWLKRIYIDQHSGDVSLIGGSLSPDLVPQFMQALKKTSLFKARLFKTFLLENDSQHAYLNFEIATLKLLTEDESQDNSVVDVSDQGPSMNALTDSIVKQEVQ